MQKIVLKKMGFYNFKGFKELEIDFEGQDFEIKGANATGKTTIVDGFTWLLFGKDSQNKADFEIKTLNPDGTNKSNLEHMVYADLLIDDQEKSFCRMYKEKWTRKKGAATKEFTGHETKYWVDGVPLGKAKFQEKIAELISEGLFKILTDPKYFNEVLHWEKRRETLLSICGDISDTEVFSMDKELEQLPDMMKGKTFDEFRDMVKSQKKKVNEELKTIPVRIDEASQNIPDISGYQTKEELEKTVEELEKERSEVQQEIQNVNSDGRLAELQRRKTEMKTKRLDKEFSEKQKLYQEIKPLQEEITKKTEELKAQEKEKEKYSGLAEKEQSSLSVIINEIAVLRDKWYKENRKEYVYENRCSKCGQTIPEDDIEAARKEFNSEKASKLEAINIEGAALQKEKTGRQANLEDYKKMADSFVPKIKAIQDKINELDKKVESLQLKAKNLVIDKDGEELKLEEQIDSFKNSESNLVFINEKEAEIATIKEKIDVANYKITCIKDHNTLNKRVEELKSKEIDMINQYEDLEYKLYLTDVFIKKKVSLLEEKINSYFKKANFKLFKENINGGVDPTCIMTYKGVPYSSLNNAARINLGLDIINTLSGYYEVSVPVFIDNAEAVNVFNRIEAQAIFLVVTDDEKLEMGKLSA